MAGGKDEISKGIGGTEVKILERSHVVAAFYTTIDLEGKVPLLEDIGIVEDIKNEARRSNSSMAAGKVRIVYSKTSTAAKGAEKQKEACWEMNEDAEEDYLNRKDGETNSILLQ